MDRRDLGTLGGTNSFASDINDTAQVVGWSETATGERHAFITTLNGMDMKDLGTLGGTNSFASGINDAGQVVGWAETVSGETHAFITGPDGRGMTDLNSLVDLPTGVILTEAIAINDRGQVVAAAVPEPEVYAMLLAGLGLLGFISRRRRPILQTLSPTLK